MPRKVRKRSKKSKISYKIGWIYLLCVVFSTPLLVIVGFSLSQFSHNSQSKQCSNKRLLGDLKESVSLTI
ncbi:MAG: hypothetical protein ACOC04_06155, partial [Halothece sp.]